MDERERAQVNPDVRRRPPRRWLAVAAGVLIVLGAFVTLYGLTRSSPQPAPELSSGGTATAGTRTLTVDELSGNWTLADDGQSFVGYRIDETYSGINSSQTVTGRTPAVKATMIIKGRDVHIAAVEADLTKLTSDDAKRDDALKTRGLETEKYPRAVFALTQDINVTEVPPPGSQGSFRASGEINLHGTRRPLELELSAQLIPGNPPIIEVIGVQPVNLRDFGIEPPDVAGLLTVKDQGALELKLRFVPA